MSSSLPIYYINLDNRTDRRDFMEEQFARLGLSVERVAAVPAGSAVPAALSRHVDLERARYLGPVVTACAMSHMLCWKALLARDDESQWALILEDDAILSDALPSFLDEFLPLADSLGVDAVQLETRRRPVRAFPSARVLPSGRKLVRFRSAREGTACYLMSRRGAKTLLARADLFDQPVDLSVFRPFFGPGRSIRTVLTNPALCMQLDEAGVESTSAHSDIASSRWTAIRADKRRFAQAHLRTVNFFDHLIHLPAGLKRMVIPFDGQVPGGAAQGARTPR